MCSLERILCLATGCGKHFCVADLGDALLNMQLVFAVVGNGLAVILP